ncbi:sensor domain-containing protein [Mycolicibacterium anyangense]|uniref:Sensor domain-containing protein n=1 Tax=Mycolicibacterium anyangense TaxID=1431246 RepID=A0A6N4W427_9MYCO|nr:sensor domain-containing protein [Mycolicibacterium anyangense]BBZ76670.1 sensor domain-containing protein [Mycolicibacterium anyangense]
MMRRIPVLYVTALLASALASGCASTVAGTAVRTQGTGKASVNLPDLTESDLGRVLLSVGQINGVMGSTGIRETGSTETLSDNSAVVSDVDCLGAMYGAEEKVYRGSGWSAVRDEVLQEPTDDNDHWVEQIAVLFPSAGKAQQFLEESRTTWQSCEKASVDVDRTGVHATWDIGAADVSGEVLTQGIEQQDAGGWGCQHAMASAANLIVEVWACSDSIGDEAKSIATGMLAKVAKK